MKKNSTLYILVALLVILIGLSIVLIISNSKKTVIIEDITAQFELEKEELQDDYSQLALQYEDYGIRINNDSLAELLDAERTKNLRLLDEIKTLKVNNARRLSELRKELETARTVMRSYIIQIDSLNTINTQLREENTAMSKQFQEAQQTVNELSKEKEALTEKVMLASMLEARDIEIRPLTEKGRTANKIARTSLIEFKMVLSKNISAPVGEKTIYLRITQPDGMLLLKPQFENFEFEGYLIPCSASRTIEWDGEEQALAIYWQVEEFLHPGTYRAEIFADGYLIGSEEFTLSN